MVKQQEARVPFAICSLLAHALNGFLVPQTQYVELALE